MHCNQPLCGNGFPYGPYSNCTPPIQCGGLCPQIIGEGDITSVTLPDGTVQFLFNPSMEWSRYQFNPSNANMNCCGPYMNLNTGAWLIRSIANPIPASNYIPARQRYEPPRPFYETDCNLNAHNGFQIKFHNDNCTSTSDIHYFYPSLRRYECYARTPPQACAAVQVEVPITDNAIHHYICAKPCNCVPMHCYDTEGSQGSSMSIENRSKENIKCSSNKESKKGKKHASRERKKLSKTKSNKVICECDKASKVSVVDKSVTTYADSASNCAPAGGRETQTCCGNPVQVVNVKKVLKGDNVQTERWYPKTQTSKKQMENKSMTKIIGISSSCSSNCSCRSDTE